MLRWNRLLEIHLAAGDDLNDLYRGNVALDSDLDPDAVRPCPCGADDSAGPLPIHFEQQQWPGCHEAVPFRGTFEPRGKPDMIAQGDVCLTITKLATGRIVAGPDARETIADVQNVIPPGELDSTIDPELKQLDAAAVLLSKVGINCLRITAMRVEGEPTRSHCFTACLSIKRPVVSIDFLALQDKIITPI